MGVEDWKIKKIEKTPESQAYFDMMVREKSQVQKKPASTIQSASTQKLLSMTDEELTAYRNRSIDLSKARAEHPDKVARRIDAQEMGIYERMRRGAKNQLGESKKSASSEERKSKAIDAYVFTPPAPLTEVEIERVVKLNKIKELDELIAGADRTPTLWDKFKNWFAGDGPIEERKRLTKEFMDEWNLTEEKEK